ncbi:MAG: RNA methyltransferase [Gemmatimonadaceae bacterium]|nr:RNA methyltransferase [Gemmatimonadaceae bacterium]
MTVARALQHRKAREERARFVAEGVRTVEELLRSPIDVDGVLLEAGATASPRVAALAAAAEARGIAIATADARDFASAAGTEAPQGVLAIARTPATALDALPPSAARLLVLDAVQDPGNAGTILRTAAALGVSATIALPGTVDLWNAKVVRSAMGASFTHPTLVTTVDALAAFLAARGIPLWGADAQGDDVGSAAAPPTLALAVGNEGAGLTPGVRAHCARLVALPIAPVVDSLNVAVATGILLYALRP